LAPSAAKIKIKLKRGETLHKKKGKSTKEANKYTQILSKNELVINTEEEEEGRRKEN